MSTTDKRRLARPEAGFTLIEILVAIAIVMVVSGAATVGYFALFAGAQRDTAVNEIRQMAQAVKNFKLREHRYPRENEWPAFLLEGSDKLSGGYLEGSDVEDPWGNEYRYSNPNNNKEFDIISYGEDGVQGGEGDAADISYRKDVLGEDD